MSNWYQTSSLDKTPDNRQCCNSLTKRNKQGEPSSIGLAFHLEASARPWCSRRKEPRENTDISRTRRDRVEAGEGEAAGIWGVKFPRGSHPEEELSPHLWLNTKLCTPRGQGSMKPEKTQHQTESWKLTTTRTHSGLGDAPVLTNQSQEASLSNQ